MVQALYILFGYLLFAILFERLKVGSIFGLLIAGAVIGPSGIRLVRDVDSVSALADLGIVFLLFNVGLELKLDRIRLFGVRVYFLAALQLVATTAAIAAIAQVLGLRPEASIIIGTALSLSSTALVLQILADLERTLTQLGRLAVATLLLQDLAVAPMLVAVNLLTEGSGIGETLGIFALGAVVSVAIVLSVGRFVLPVVLRNVAELGASEYFMAAAVLVVLGASWATEQAGLSPALGAFLAGLTVADTEYRQQIAADIAPFRGLFLGLFFMTIGMKADLGVAASEPATIAAVTILLVFTKGIILAIIALVLGYRLRLATELAILLSQGSEFSFVVLGTAVGTNLIAAPIGVALTASVALTMIITPLAAAAGRHYLDRTEGRAASPLPELDASTADLRGHVIVIGFGQVGMALTRHLMGLKVPLFVLDSNALRVRTANALKLPIFFGNATRSDVLRAMHIDRAQMVIVALPDPDTSLQIVSAVRRLSPHARILARAPDEIWGARLRDAGADAAVIDGLTTALDLAERAALLHENGKQPETPIMPEPAD